MCVVIIYVELDRKDKIMSSYMISGWKMDDFGVFYLDVNRYYFRFF